MRETHPLVVSHMYPYWGQGKPAAEVCGFDQESNTKIICSEGTLTTEQLASVFDVLVTEKLDISQRGGI